MSASSSEFRAFVLEQLSPIGDVSCARFFGGYSLKSQAVLFAMIMDNALYFAVNEDTRADYKKLGSRCFSYDTKNGRVEVKRFFEVPGDIIEDQQRLIAFAQAALAAAHKSTAIRKPRRRKATADDHALR